MWIKRGLLWEMDLKEMMFFALANYAGVILVVLAFTLDLLLGDPRSLPHPVIIMGRLISFLEQALRRIVRGVHLELIAGGTLVILLVTFVYFLSKHILSFFYGQNLLLGNAVSVYLLYTTLALKSLQDHIRAVEQPLFQGDLEGARKALSFLVGRDTDKLLAPEVSRGALESLSENSSDGVIAPLFYAFIGGAPLALAYKGISTMDSMLGYRNSRYLYFGRVAAKLDDLANYIPARLTALLLLAAALLVGKIPFRFARKCLMLIWREGKNHASPNSGYPEAAAAVLLGVRLGGNSTYNGVLSRNPVINSEGEAPALTDLAKLRSLVQHASLLALLVGVVLSLAIQFLF